MQKQFLLTVAAVVISVSPASSLDKPQQNSARVNRSGSGQAVQPGGQPGGNHSRALQHLKDPIKLAPNAPMWERYLQGGQILEKQGDKAKAKAYYLESLKQLENTPRFATHMTGKIARLQSALLRMYPKFPTEKTPAEGAQQIKNDEEEIQTLNRLRRIHQLYPNGSSLMLELVDTQIRFAQQDLAKNKAAVANSTADAAKQ